MKKYIFKRVLYSVVAILVLLLLLFLMLDLMPGSPFNDDKLSEEQILVLEQKYGLDDPFLVRYFRYIFNIAKGDFGVSYNIASNVPITELLKNRVPTSIRLGGQAVLLGASIGLVLGLVAALKHNTIFDTIATIISVLGVSLPSYVFALALSYTLGYQAGWFPLLYDSEMPFISSVMPTVALSMFSMANIARFTRTEMLEVLRSDYMLLAESKGISGPKLIIRHALRNALIPIITVLGPLIVNTMTGSLVIEKIFSIPGIGELMVRSIQQNDYNVTIALSFIYSLMYIGIMLVVDILYGIIDPRIRLSKEDNHES
ncbi:MAG: ABC transporter permease [Oscillospiraceae bacterium]|nr:ABC transporter permease [Oscillospiraceae bacterium]MBQ3560850.1 ABC transporter permease [Oscillospiraceae bacterium]MBQ6699651.1 ABC transporter permease [Oscillospiraceae bacterium]